MNYLKIKRKLRYFIKRRKNKKYIKILINRKRAEVTIETAIVFTIIMIVICSILYFSLYLHDKVAIKSYTYSGLVEAADKDEDKCKELVQSKIAKAPTFVIKPSASVLGDFNKYSCDVSGNEHSAMNFLERLFTFTTDNQEVEVVRKMPIDKMYLFKAIKDGIKK